MTSTACQFKKPDDMHPLHPAWLTHRFAKPLEGGHYRYRWSANKDGRTTIEIKELFMCFSNLSIIILNSHIFYINYKVKVINKI